jgi:hypothetical protein
VNVRALLRRRIWDGFMTGADSTAGVAFDESLSHSMSKAKRVVLERQ